MVDLTELAEVLAQHREAEHETPNGWVTACDCGWDSDGSLDGEAAYFAHVAAACEEVLVAHYEAGLVEGSMIGDPDVAEVRERGL